MSDSIGSVSVEVVPDATGFPEKLRAKLKDTSVNVKVDPDLTGFKAKLDEATRKQSVKVDADLQDRSFAAKLRELVRPRKVTVEADLDDRTAKTRLKELTRPRSVAIHADVQGSGGGVGGLTSDLLSLKGAAITLGPALIPATAAIVGLTGALAAPAAGAGTAVGFFAAISAAAIKKASTDLKAIQKVEQKAAAETDPGKSAELSKLAQQMRADLPKSERDLFASVGRIQDRFDDFIRKTGPNVYGLFTEALNVGTKTLPKLVPLINAVGLSLKGTVKDLGNFADSPRFKSFIDYLAHDGVRAMHSFIDIAGHLTSGLASIFKAFTPAGQGLLDRFSNSLRGFDHIGQSGGMQKFLAYIRDVGPKVADTIGHVGQAVGHLILALAPQGSTVLGVIDELAVTVAKMEPGQIAAVAGAVGALGLATGKFGKLTSLSLLVSAVSYAYKHSSAFRALADDAGGLAKALNDLPAVIKIPAGLTAIAGLLALRGKGGGGGIAGAAGRLLGGGVQKVFVVNLPAGGLGGLGGLGGSTAKGGKLSKAGGVLGKAGALTATLVIGGAIMSEASKKSLATSVAAGVGTGAAVGFEVAGPAGAAVGAAVGGGIGALNHKDKNNPQYAYADAASPKNAKNVTAMAHAYGVLQTEYNKLTKGASPERLKQLLDIPGPVRQDAQQMAILQEKIKTATGLSTAEFRKQLPALAAGRGAVTKAASNYRTFAANAKYAGVSTRVLNGALSTLPSQVQTKILTPGALKSKADVRALGKQYGLTPRQIKTLIALFGAEKAGEKTKKTRDHLSELNNTKAKPKVELDGADSATSKARGATKVVRTLGVQNAKPKVTLNDQVTGPARRAQAAINALHGKSVAINITTYKSVQAGRAQGAAKRGDIHAATGGWIHGPGTSTSDSIHARLSTGEFVVNAAAAKQNAALLESINGARTSASRTQFRTGGEVAASGQTVQFNGPIYGTNEKAVARVLNRRLDAAAAMAGTP